MADEHVIEHVDRLIGDLRADLRTDREQTAAALRDLRQSVDDLRSDVDRRFGAGPPGPPGIVKDQMATVTTVATAAATFVASAIAAILHAVLRQPGSGGG
ncbi:MAG: hypothetical protein IT340_19955 [Chloroflexi bacterium]|nr:hypothetical protein [Chloroflexota bacterium]